MNRYDTYGRLESEPWVDIKKGDKIKYVDTILVGEGIRKKIRKVTLTGYWDGEKVQFNDDQKTVVRTKRWLTKLNILQNERNSTLQR